MKKTVITIFLILLSFNTFADRRDLVSRIQNLSDNIYEQVENSYASQEELQKVKKLLRRGLRILSVESEIDYDRTACIDFAYQKYYMGLSSSRALEKANTACSTFKDLIILKEMFYWFYKSQNSTKAMDSAIVYSGVTSRGKIEIARYLYQQFYKGFNAAKSARKTGESLPFLNKNSLGCLKQNYDINYRSYSSTKSIEKAIKSCSN